MSKRRAKECDCFKGMFEKNFAKIKYISVLYSSRYENVQTASDATDAQKNELKDIAENYLESLKNGESIDKLIDKEAHASGEEHDHEDGEIAETEATFIQKDTSDDPDDFNKKIFEAKYNTPTLTENNTYGYYVFVRYKIDSDGKDYDEKKSDILSAMKADEFAEIMEKAAKDIKITENSAAIKRYKPQNVVLGY